MAFGAVSVFTNCCKSRVSNASVYTRQYELNHHNNPRDNGGNHNHHLRVCIKQMVRRQYNPLISVFRRYSRLRLSIQSDNTWLRLLSRSNNKSSQPGTVSNRDRKRNRNYLYYCIIISLLAINPVKANEGETNNTSNPVAAATGNVTNQAVQFQNNGAPSRQVYGANNSCNGATVTFSPFYMGNHTTPFDDQMEQQSYTVAENWGGQVNFMVPLDGSTVELCKSIARKHAAKMDLDYELVRVLKCAEIQQKGFMLVPGSRVYHMCNDVIPIVAFKNEVKKEQIKQCIPIEEFRFPWQKQRQKCPLKYKPLNQKKLLNPYQVSSPKNHNVVP